MNKYLLASLTIITAVSALSGCSAQQINTSSYDSLAPSVPAQSSRSMNPYSNLSESDPRAVSFVQQFRSQFPQLAGDADRPARYVLKNGSSLCADMYSKNIVSMEQAKRHAAMWVIGDSVTRQANDAESVGIVSLSINTICPEYKSILSS